MRAVDGQVPARGGLGEVYLAKGLCYKWRHTISKTPDEPVPAGVDYDLWLGPAPERPFNRNRFHYNWHWNWDYGNGDMGNQGVHEMDIARWGLGVKLPTRICAMGGHLMFDDDQHTPNALMADLRVSEPEGGGDKKKILQFEVRHWITNSEDAMWIRKRQHRTGTWPAPTTPSATCSSAPRATWPKTSRTGRPSWARSASRAPRARARPTITRTSSTPSASPIRRFQHEHRGGLLFLCLIHLGNISYRLGRSLDFDPATMRFRQRCRGQRDADARIPRAVCGSG